MVDACLPKRDITSVCAIRVSLEMATDVTKFKSGAAKKTYVISTQVVHMTAILTDKYVNAKTDSKGTDCLVLLFVSF